MVKVVSLTTFTEYKNTNFIYGRKSNKFNISYV